LDARLCHQDRAMAAKLSTDSIFEAISVQKKIAHPQSLFPPNEFSIINTLHNWWY
jgi:hypothetical protein